MCDVWRELFDELTYLDNCIESYYEIVETNIISCINGDIEEMENFEELERQNDKRGNYGKFRVSF